MSVVENIGLLKHIGQNEIRKQGISVLNDDGFGVETLVANLANFMQCEQCISKLVGPFTKVVVSNWFFQFAAERNTFDIMGNNIAFFVLRFNLFNAHDVGVVGNGQPLELVHGKVESLIKDIHSRIISHLFVIVSNHLFSFDKSEALVRDQGLNKFNVFYAANRNYLGFLFRRLGPVFSMLCGSSSKRNLWQRGEIKTQRFTVT